MKDVDADNTGRKLLEPGDMFGDYTVERLLGKGGMGAVYLVRAPGGERYAVKVMFPDVVKKSPGYRKRFAREAEFAMKIRHKNLISVYDVGEDPETGLCYIIMDYVPGGSVADRLERCGRFSIAEAVSIAAQVALGLEVAHRHGVIHRDIKPDNIMFDADGTPKLADLGVAKFTDEAHKTTVTTTGMIIGTPAYMAPEQMMDSRHIDTRADLYALGVVLYEMLTGIRPNEGSTAIELLAKALKGEPLPDVRTMRPEVSAAIAHVLTLMCAPKPDGRPSTALEAAHLLQKAATGRLDIPKKTPRAADAAAWKARWRWPLLVVAAIAVVALSTFLGVAFLGKSPEDGPVSTPPDLSTNVVEQTVVVSNAVNQIAGMTNAAEGVSSLKPMSFDLGDGVKMEMVGCPAGTFTMGYEGGGPMFAPHKVTITRPFWIAKLEVTREQWVKFMPPLSLTAVEEALGGMKAPVSDVSRQDIDVFCDKMTRKFQDDLPNGYVVRLPTESEWEYAYKANAAPGTPYGELAMSNKDAGDILIDLSAKSRILKDKGVPCDMQSSQLPGVVGGQRRANAWGIYDMRGNVDEITFDLLPRLLPNGSERRTPVGLDYRDSSDPLAWTTDDDCCSIVRRHGRSPHGKMVLQKDRHEQRFGFRLAVGPDLLKERGIMPPALDNSSLQSSAQKITTERDEKVKVEPYVSKSRLHAFYRSKDRKHVFVQTSHYWDHDSYNTPPCSLSRVKEMIAAKTDCMHIPLSRSRDGVLFASKPNGLEKTSDGHGNVRDFVASELKNLKLKWRGQLTTEGFATFEEVLRIGKGKMLFDISGACDCPREVEALLDRLDAWESVIIESIGSKGWVNGEELHRRFGENVWRKIQSGQAQIMVGYKDLADWRKVTPECMVWGTSSDVVARELIGIPERITYSLLIDRPGRRMDDEKGWAKAIAEGGTVLRTNRPRDLIRYLERRNSGNGGNDLGAGRGQYDLNSPELEASNDSRQIRVVGQNAPRQDGSPVELKGPYGLVVKTMPGNRSAAEKWLSDLETTWLPAAVKFYGNPNQGKQPERPFVVTLDRNDARATPDYLCGALLTQVAEPSREHFISYVGNFVSDSVHGTDRAGTTIRHAIQAGREITGKKREDSKTNLDWQQAQKKREYGRLCAALEEIRARDAGFILKYCTLKNRRYDEGKIGREITWGQMAELMGEAVGFDVVTLFSKHGIIELPPGQAANKVRQGNDVLSHFAFQFDKRSQKQAARLKEDASQLIQKLDETMGGVLAAVLKEKKMNLTIFFEDKNTIKVYNTDFAKQIFRESSKDWLGGRSHYAKSTFANNLMLFVVCGERSKYRHGMWSGIMGVLCYHTLVETFFGLTHSTGAYEPSWSLSRRLGLDTETLDNYDFEGKPISKKMKKDAKKLRFSNISKEDKISWMVQELTKTYKDILPAFWKIWLVEKSNFASPMTVDDLIAVFSIATNEKLIDWLSDHGFTKPRLETKVAVPAQFKERKPQMRNRRN